MLYGLSDVALTGAAFEAAYQTRLHWQLSENVFFLTTSQHLSLLLFCLLIWVLLGRWLGVYGRLDPSDPRTVVRDTTRQCGLGAISLILFEYTLRLNLSRPFVGLVVGYAWLFLLVFRWNASRVALALRSGFSQPRVILVVGTGDRAQRFARRLEAASHYGFRLFGFMADTTGQPPTAIQLDRKCPVYRLEELSQLLRENVIDEILFAVESERLAALEEVFLLCDEEGVRTGVAVDFFPHINSELSLDRFQDLPLLTFSASPDDEIRLFAKRILDVVVAVAALIVLSPFMLLIAALIKLTSSGPVIFRQVRCGLNGRRFLFYKFRSMVQNAEELKAHVAHLNQKQTAFKIPNDPRLTPIGRFLRKYSIDEWPQLYNVLRGDMSLVGPRPAVPEEVDNYQRWQRRRLRMRPGLTCLWAVSGRDALDFDTWMRMDMQYIDNWSLGLDWKILLRTIPHVLSGKGAY